MNTSINVLVLLALTIITVNATIHTACFNYFKDKDKCVHSAASDDLRCKVDPQNHPAPVSEFGLKVQTPSRLQRRYDDDTPSFVMRSGHGICGKYDTDKDLGVCLWSGAEQTKPTVATAGWLNGLKTSNCHKQVYIQRVGFKKGDTVEYVPVLDGCSFNTTKREVGCFEIGVTRALFKKFNPSPKEKKAQMLFGGMTWDWNNLTGNKTSNGPV